jgi:hypothetical protein
MPWRHMGEWRYISTILDPSTRRRWVVSFTHWLLYPWGSSPQYPLDRRLGGPQSWSGFYGEEKNLAPVGNYIPAVPPLASCYTDWATGSFLILLQLQFSHVVSLLHTQLSSHPQTRPGSKPQDPRFLIWRLHIWSIIWLVILSVKVS